MKKEAWKMTGMFMALLGAATLASAQQGQQRPQGQKGGGRGEMMKKYDVDGDGKLSETELEKMKADREAMGAKQGERKGPGGAPGGAPGGERPSREAMMMNRFDVDKSGSLDLEECAAMLKALDERTGVRPDSSGRGAPGDAASREQMMKKFDKNGDGELNDEERAALRASFGDRKGGPPGGNSKGGRKGGGQPKAD